MLEKIVIALPLVVGTVAQLDAAEFEDDAPGGIGGRRVGRYESGRGGGKECSSGHRTRMVADAGEGCCFGDTTWRTVSRGANPGTDSQFPAKCAGNLVSVPGLRLTVSVAHSMMRGPRGGRARRAEFQQVRDWWSICI